MLESSETNDAKQRVRMSELQEELAQTIKRIETLQRGGGGFGSGRGLTNNNSGNRRGYGSSNRNQNTSANRISPYGGSKNSRNSSTGAQNVNKYGQNQNKPLPSYMKPTGANTRSNERSGSYAKKSSPASRLPANYKPPHLRNNYTGVANAANRVSPGAPRVGVNNSRTSPNTRLYG